MFPPFDVPFHVFAPNQMTVQKTDDVPIAPPGFAGAAMTVVAKLHAVDAQGVEHAVSFGRLVVQDNSVPASDMEGFFASKQSLLITSDARPGPVPVGEDDNTLAHAFNVAINGDVVAEPPQWSAGSFFFDIPWVYDVIGAPGTHHTQRIEFTHVQRSVGMQGPGGFFPVGTVTVSEIPAGTPGVCTKRAPNEEGSRPCP
jgi:hypothetical protein